MSALQVWAAIAPTVGIAIGYGGTIYSEGRRDARKTTAAANLRATLRAEQMVDGRASFELDTLLRAHSRMSDFLRALGRGHHADTMIYKETGTYGSAQLPPDVSDGIFRATRALIDVTGLVLEDTLRELMGSARDAGNCISGSKDKADADRRMLTATNACGIARDAIAARIREIYQVPATMR